MSKYLPCVAEHYNRNVEYNHIIVLITVNNRRWSISKLLKSRVDNPVNFQECQEL